MKGNMSKLVGAVAAVTALTAGVVYQIDPLTNLERAFFAFLLGAAGATIWQAMITGGGKVILHSEKAHSADESAPDEIKEAA